MGTVPTPALHSASTALVVAETTSWYNTMAFLLKPPACQVLTNADVALTAGVRANIPFAAEGYDYVMAGDTEQHSTSTNNERIYARTAGRYQVNADIAITPASNSVVTVWLVKNGTDVMNWAWNPIVAGVMRIEVEAEIQKAVGDYIHFSIQSSAGATLQAVHPTRVNTRWVSN